METHFLEACNGGNHGKFMLARFTAEQWSSRSALPGYESDALLARRGWTPAHLWMLDLQTGEGALFLPGGLPSADLDKHRIWVCPLFEPTLAWLYAQDLRPAKPLSDLPSFVELPDAPFAMSGYRRSGPPDPEQRPPDGSSPVARSERRRVPASLPHRRR